MTATIKPIETHYKGCRFRSRLEARWAVFFDALGVPWEYEPQGYVVDGTPYLPDFWLPSMELWVEVKGVLSHRDLDLIVRAAGGSGLPLGPDDPRRPTPGDPATWGLRILLLGPIPEPKGAPQHPVLASFTGTTVAYHSFWGETRGQWRIVPMGEPSWVSRLIDLGEDGTATSRANMLDPAPLTRVMADPLVTAARQAARSARFEHGESGATSAVPKAPDPYRRIRPLLNKLEIDFGAGLAMVIDRFDIKSPEGRVAALRTTAPMVADVDDAALRESWTDHLSVRLSMDLPVIQEAVRRAMRQRTR